MADRKSTKREVRRAAKKESPRRRSPSLTSGWVALLFAVLVVIFFHEVFLGGKTFTSPDTVAPAGFVRMGQQALYQQHTYPLWNPFVFLGMPSFASAAYNPLIYPPDWPLALVQKVVPLPDMTWLLLYYFLGALGMFLLARDWGARPQGALLAGAVFVFAPNLVAVGSHGHGSQLVDSAYLPWMLWLASRWLKRGNLADLGWLALAGGFQMLRGHVQICFYTWAAIGLYAVVDGVTGLRDPARRVTSLVRVAAVAGAAALAFGIAGFYTLPLRDYAQYSIRGSSDAGGGAGAAYATQWSMAFYELPSVLFPGWVGFGGGNYWGAMPFTDYPNPYLGLVAVLLAVPAFFGRGRARVFALLLALGAILISFGKYFPLYGFLYDHLPLFNKFRIPVMVLLLFQLAAALGLAWGWSDVLEARENDAGRARLDRALMILMIAVAIGCFGGFLLQGSWQAGYVSAATSHNPNIPPAVAANDASALAGDLAKAGALGLIALGAAWMALRRRLSIPFSTAIVFVILLVELWPVSGRVMKPVIGEPKGDVLEVGRNDTVQWLEKVAPLGTFRIFPIDEFQSNRFAGFGIASLGGYHPAKPRLFQDLLDAQAPGMFRWQRLLNVRFILIQRLYQDIPDYLQPVFQGQTNVVLENTLALPRATIVGRYEVVQPDSAIIDSVSLGTQDLAQVTYLASDPHLELGPVDGARATIESYRLNDVTIKVSTPGPGLLRLSDEWYPDWKATVDGKPAPILRADYLLRAVPIPAGEHTVVFRYSSPAVRNGLMLTLASLVVVLLLIVFGVRSRRVPARTTPVAEG
jgi:Bacterial membrane protein YfhO